ASNGTSWSRPRGETEQTGMFRLAQNNDNHYLTSFSQLVDGSSNVVAIGEVSVTANVRQDLTNRVFPIWAGGNNDWAGQWRICSWARLMGPTCYLNNRTVADVVRSLSWSDYSFGSQHPGGAQFLFGDGKVKFISESIDMLTYSRIGNIRDGEPISLQ
ncbi:MAG: DUF1559 domain-containing protein, partial [Planctomycetes bacterium]|nr:DUF1559 domain-containing protein [Planctomycetota bacterium]